MISAGAKCALEGVFAHILICTKISDIQSEGQSDLSDILQRLSTIFWALDPDPDDFGEVGLELAAARYLFRLPTVFSDSLTHLLRLQDGRAQVVLLYYFAAITQLRSESSGG